MIADKQVPVGCELVFKAFLERRPALATPGSRIELVPTYAVTIVSGEPMVKIVITLAEIEICGKPPLCWSLALGACIGGNGSLIGATANVTIAGFAERAGHRIGVLSFMAMAFPLMLMSIVIATIYVYLLYL